MIQNYTAAKRVIFYLAGRELCTGIQRNKAVLMKLPSTNGIRLRKSVLYISLG